NPFRSNTRASGGRTWWAQIAFTRMNIAPTILPKQTEERHAVRATERRGTPRGAPNATTSPINAANCGNTPPALAFIVHYSLVPFRNTGDTCRLDPYDRRVVKVPAADARRPYVSSLIPRAGTLDIHVRRCQSRSCRVTPVTRRRPRQPPK